MSDVPCHASALADRPPLHDPPPESARLDCGCLRDGGCDCASRAPSGPLRTSADVLLTASQTALDAARRELAERPTAAAHAELRELYCQVFRELAAERYDMRAWRALAILGWLFAFATMTLLIFMPL